MTFYERDPKSGKTDRSLKELTTTPPMSEQQHKALKRRTLEARRSIEDRMMEKKLNER